METEREREDPTAQRPLVGYGEEGHPPEAQDRTAEGDPPAVADRLPDPLPHETPPSDPESGRPPPAGDASSDRRRDLGSR
jgi:hypothetical protein